MDDALTFDDVELDDMGVVQVTENRNFIQRARDWYNNLRESYIENYIENGKAQEIEQRIDQYAEDFKNGVKTVSGVANAAAPFIPAQSVFSKIVKKIAMPALCKLADIAAKIQKKLFIGGKRFIEKHFLHVDGTNPTIEAYDFDNGTADLIEDWEDTKEAYQEVSEGWSK